MCSCRLKLVESGCKAYKEKKHVECLEQVRCASSVLPNKEAKGLDLDTSKDPESPAPLNLELLDAFHALSQIPPPRAATDSVPKGYGVGSAA